MVVLRTTALLLGLSIGGEATAAPAFPGAEGYGKDALGGRGGKVIPVTRLDDAFDAGGKPAAGTLRACVNDVVPRTCVFRVGGVLVLTNGALHISNPFITIAGQTAPGGGILITHDGRAAARTPILVKGTTDVVIRHVRSRPRKSPAPTSNDAFTIEDAQKVILDHVSGSWAQDENVNLHAGANNVTITDSIFAEGLEPHSKCALLSSGPTAPQRITFARNLCASNDDRNPDLHSRPQSCLDVINNVFYNAKNQFTEIWGNYGETWANVAGNTYRKGPSTLASRYALAWQAAGATGVPKIFAYDNLADGAGVTLIEPELQPYLTATPVCPLSVGRDSQKAAYGLVLANAGAFPRDQVDKRIIAEVKNRTGKVRGETGPIPSIANGSPYPDVDGDGMSDSWEEQYGLTPGLNDAWLDPPDADGFFPLDRFLHYAHQQRLAGASIP